MLQMGGLLYAKCPAPCLPESIFEPRDSQSETTGTQSCSPCSSVSVVKKTQDDKQSRPILTSLMIHVTLWLTCDVWSCK